MNYKTFHWYIDNLGWLKFRLDKNDQTTLEHIQEILRGLVETAKANEKAEKASE